MRIGIDVGGTHTDAVLIDGAEVLASLKTLTTSDVQSGVERALDTLLKQAEIKAEQVQAVMIGTTQFTNAVIERRHLGKAALLRIALPSGERIPPMSDWPDDLADALGRHAFMIHGGKTFDGHAIAAIDETEIDAVADSLLKRDIDLLAISAVFSPSDPSQETAVAQRLKRRIPSLKICLSHTIGRMGILERENAALLNASLFPLADRVIAAFRDALAARSFRCPFFVSQNDGTLMEADFARRFPALTFASGPTNSLRGASFLTDCRDAIVVDIGGTTTDIGVLKDGFPRQSNLAIRVGGVRTNFRMPDILAIGLGGGSVVRDEGRALGPDSVGHELVTKGLVFGGEVPTATDIAVASGKATVGDPRWVADLDDATVAAALGRIHEIVNEGIERMKTSREPADVILVGGGAILVSSDLPAAAAIQRPAYAEVANAIGAACAQLGAETEQLVSYADLPREDALASIQKTLTDELVDAGAARESISMADIEETPLSYMAKPTTRLRVKMVGDLQVSSTQAAGEGAR